jgi:hypothetical protein
MGGDESAILILVKLEIKDFIKALEIEHMFVL